ncbi:MAG: AAA family ATPase [Acholeplasmatales bacterium]|nr:AAA family ATPase [Acholeplasmatales bacterium]
MIELTNEQQLFIDTALKGKNILVEACIGSGKTTSIQHLCNQLPKNKKILYLTYNRLLKVDAKSKIKNRNAFVTNYHGFAYRWLMANSINVGRSDIIQTFLSEKPKFDKYDILIMDEYQDIDEEISNMLKIIKESNPNMQLIAVGDMEQKIYDKTRLDVKTFINSFLGDYIILEFSICFRLNKELADKLGFVWKKKITGVNDDCNIKFMNFKEVVNFLANCDNKDILCLGARTGDATKVLNTLEEKYPEKFNKNTVYASIRDNDNIKSVDPNKDSAIFTTYDSSKGLEYPTCVLFDFDIDYWYTRLSFPNQKYEILRNIFCVAASRGKKNIIFVKGENMLLNEKILASSDHDRNEKELRVNISEMFDFKYKESVEDCYKLLTIKKIENEDSEIIDVESTDGLIDLSPCIGIYQEAFYFKHYNIDKDITLYVALHDLPDFHLKNSKKLDVEGKVLYLVSLETRHNRYRNQVVRPFILEEEKNKIFDRLSKKFTKNEDVQHHCEINFSDYTKYKFRAEGFVDVLKNDVVYELKFVSELTHEHFLQCACYVVGLGLKKGILWNTRDNSMYEVSVRGPKKFLNAVAKAVLKL